MESYFDKQIEKGIEKGVEKEKKEEITRMISFMRLANNSDIQIKKLLISTFQLSNEEADNYLKALE